VFAAAAFDDSILLMPQICHLNVKSGAEKSDVRTPSVRASSLAEKMSMKRKHVFVA
jgi:hypothetical protein